MWTGLHPPQSSGMKELSTFILLFWLKVCTASGFERQSKVGHLIKTKSDKPKPVKLGHPMTLSCKANQVKIKSMRITLKFCRRILISAFSSRLSPEEAWYSILTPSSKAAGLGNSLDQKKIFSRIFQKVSGGHKLVFKIIDHEIRYRKPL